MEEVVAVPGRAENPDSDAFTITVTDPDPALVGGDREPGVRGRECHIRSVDAQAEGVPRWVEEDPEGRPGLVVVLGRA